MTHYFKHKARGKKFGTIIGWVILGIVAVVGLALVFGYGLMWLWNWLMPELFGLPSLTFWQAVGVFVLAKILFGSGHHGRGNHKKNNRACNPRDRSHFGKDFAKWKHYDKFWQEEGEQAYDSYLEKMNNKKESEIN